VDHMPAGQVLEVFQFDHDLEQFVSVGAARVRENGAVVVSDPGFGVTKSGWGGAPPPPPPKKECVGGCGQCKKCQDGSCVPDGAGSACDDGKDCTFNDKCDAGGQCKGEDVRIDSVDGPCVAAVGQSASYTAVANDTSKIKWTAPGGSPADGTGGSFSTSFATEGGKVITAACDASSKSKSIEVGPSCASITPRVNEVETAQAPDAGNFGQVRRLAHSATYKGCVDGTKWCFRLEEFKEEHAIGFGAAGNTTISGAGDAAITPGTCVAVITDLTPSAANAVQGVPTAPLRTYVPLAIIEAHERFHVTDFRAKVVDPTMRDLATFVSQASHCTDCKSAVPASFNTQMETIWNGHRPTYFDGMHEARAYTVENGLMNGLIAAIRTRARNAPAAEGWPAACK
jgi:hypothetical protein